MTEQVLQLLQHALRFSALVQLALTSGQIGQLELLQLQRHHVLLEAILHDVPGDVDVPLLSQTVDTINSLLLGSGIVLRLHDIDFVSRRQIETETTSHDGNEQDAERRVGFEVVEDSRTLPASHGANEMGVFNSVSRQSNGDEIEMAGPAREDQTALS
jgi:hypothetical protein